MLQSILLVSSETRTDSWEYRHLCLFVWMFESKNCNFWPKKSLVYWQNIFKLSYTRESYLEDTVKNCNEKSENCLSYAVRRFHKLCFEINAFKVLTCVVNTFFTNHNKFFINFFHKTALRCPNVPCLFVFAKILRYNLPVLQSPVEDRPTFLIRLASPSMLKLYDCAPIVYNLQKCNNS